MTAPLWRSRPRPIYTYIHGWQLARRSGVRVARASRRAARALHLRSAAASEATARSATPGPRAQPREGGSALPAARTPRHPRAPSAWRQVERAVARGAAVPPRATPASITERDRPTLLFCSCLMPISLDARGAGAQAPPSAPMALRTSPSDRCRGSGNRANPDYCLRQLFVLARFTASPRARRAKPPRLGSAAVPVLSSTTRAARRAVRGAAGGHGAQLVCGHAGLCTRRGWRSSLSPIRVGQALLPYWLDRLGIAGRRPKVPLALAPPPERPGAPCAVLRGPARAA